MQDVLTLCIRLLFGGQVSNMNGWRTFSNFDTIGTIGCGGHQDIVNAEC